MTDEPPNSQPPQAALLEEALLAAAQEIVSTRAEADARVSLLERENQALRQQLGQLQQNLAETLRSHDEALRHVRTQTTQQIQGSVRPLEQLLGELGPYLQSTEAARAEVQRAQLQCAELQRQLTDRTEERDEARRRVQALLRQVETLEDRFAEMAPAVEKARAEAETARAQVTVLTQALAAGQTDPRTSGSQRPPSLPVGSSRRNTEPVMSPPAVPVLVQEQSLPPRQPSATAYAHSDVREEIVFPPPFRSGAGGRRD